MYVIADGHVRWRPAVDVNRLITSTTVVALAALVKGAPGRRSNGARTACGRMGRDDG